MSALRVALSGAPSFTGYWIARALVEAGHDVSALCSQGRVRYSGLRQQRVLALEALSLHVHFNVRAEDGGFAHWIRAHRPQIWIHHHHHMPDFRSPQYDLQSALRIGVEPIPAILDALADVGAKGVIYSGTFFEPGEGGVPAGGPVTPYAQSKSQVWTALQEGCRSRELLLSKCVLSNPIGPGENEDRLLPLFLRAAQEGVPFHLGAPLALGDQLPVQELACQYVELAQDLVRGIARISRPSGWQGNLRTWLAQVNQQFIVQQMKLPPVKILEAEGSKATGFRNPVNEAVAVDWAGFWSTYADWIRGGYPALSDTR